MTWRHGPVDDRIRLSMEPDDVLAEYDVASTFTTRDDKGRLYLAHWVDEDGPDADLFVVVPTSARMIDALRAGALGLRSALDQAWVWVAAVPRDGENPVACHRVASIDSIDADALPCAEFLLAPPIAAVS